MLKRPALCSISLFFLALSENVVGRSECIRNVCTVQSSSLSFFVLGDIGGLPVWPYKTYGQMRVAETLANKATDFQIALGDNFYFTGVRNVDDRRFQETFEDVYSKGDKPWYLVAGNHDHFGNVTAQIAYTKKSERWVFPDLYYSFQYGTSTGTSVDFVMIDTVTLCGNTKDLTLADNALDYLISSDAELGQPKNPGLAEKQWDWIENQADYLIVGGHYPVYSIASHGPTQCLVDRLKPLLHKYRATAYVSGHDHNLQRLSVKSDDWTVEYIVSGAASRSDRSTEHQGSVPRNSLKFHYPDGWNPFSQLGFTKGAFLRAQINPTKAKFDFYGGSGELKYSFFTDNKRSQKL